MGDFCSLHRESRAFHAIHSLRHGICHGPAMRHRTGRPSSRSMEPKFPQRPRRPRPALGISRGPRPPHPRWSHRSRRQGRPPRRSRGPRPAAGRAQADPAGAGRQAAAAEDGPGRAGQGPRRPGAAGLLREEEQGAARRAQGAAAHLPQRGRDVHDPLLQRAGQLQGPRRLLEGDRPHTDSAHSQPARREHGRSAVGDPLDRGRHQLRALGGRGPGDEHEAERRPVARLRAVRKRPCAGHGGRQRHHLSRRATRHGPAVHRRQRLR